MRIHLGRPVLSVLAVVSALAATSPRPALAAGPTVVPFAEVQAVDATFTGTVISGRAYPSMAAESIGKRAVTITGTQFVEFTAPVAGNSIVLRYSVPDNS